MAVAELRVVGAARSPGERSRAALAKDLRALLGAGAVLDPERFGPYRGDYTIQRGLQGEPDAVLCPEDADAVAAALRYCYERQLPVIARGGGTGLAGGATPIGGGVVISLERLGAVIDFPHEQARICVQAGMPTAVLARLARENGLLFAPDPGAAEQSQIGGNVATNAGGPHAFKYGRTGDALCGLQAALAPGELVDLGSARWRDYAGYDLVGMLLGSEGTLGIITAASFALRPAPQARRGFAAIFRERGEGCMALVELLGSGLQPAVLDFIDGTALSICAGGFPDGELLLGRGAGTQARFALLLEADGSEREVDALLPELRQWALEADACAAAELPAGPLWRWRDGIGPRVAAHLGGRVAEDIRVPPARFSAALAALDDAAAARGLAHCAWGHAGDGIIHANFLADSADPGQLRLAEQGGDAALCTALELGGSITGEHGVGWVKRARLGSAWSAPQLRAQAAIKRTFDPKGLLNPGKKQPICDAMQDADR